MTTLLKPGLPARVYRFTGSPLVLPVPGHGGWRVHLHAEAGLGRPLLVATVEGRPDGFLSVSVWSDGRRARPRGWSRTDGTRTDGPVGEPPLPPGVREAIALLLRDPRSLLLTLEVMGS